MAARDLTSSRMAAAGYAERCKCPFCQAPLEDEKHLYWTCPRFAQGEQPATAKASAHLAAEAAHEADGCPVFWLRGLPPKLWYEEVLKNATIDEDSYAVFE